MSLDELHISSRKSDLARLQSYLVGEALSSAAHVKINYHFKESLGDINLTDPLWKIPQKGVFTEDFTQDLLKSNTDIVVHSWKDLPTEKKRIFTDCGHFAACGSARSPASSPPHRGR